MKLGEIKIEALKLMFASDGLSPQLADLPELSSDENYKFYLAAMNGSINRCLSRYEQAQIVPSKKVEISKSAGILANGIISFNLSSLHINSVKIISVSICDDFGNFVRALEFGENNGVLKVEQFAENEIMVKYIPAIVRVSDETSDEFEIDLPASYLDMMAHFIKGELYGEDEPELAMQSREIFEKFLQGIQSADSSELKVKTIYSQTEM